MVARCALVAVLFALLAVARAQDQCGTASKGVTGGQGVVGQQLQPVQLPAGVKEANVDIPNNLCPYGQHVGTTVIACDQDVTPSVQLKSLVQGHVYRRGTAAAPGVVYTTVYCASPYRQYAGSAPPYSVQPFAVGSVQPRPAALQLQ